MQVDRTAPCSLCGKPVDAEADCWRSNVETAERVHVLCLAAAMLVDESPSRLDYEIAGDVNDAADALSDELCENPAHSQTVGA